MTKRDQRAGQKAVASFSRSPVRGGLMLGTALGCSLLVFAAAPADASTLARHGAAPQAVAQLFAPGAEPADLTVVSPHASGFFAPGGPTIAIVTKAGGNASGTTGSVSATNDGVDIYAYGGATGDVSLVTTGDILAGHSGVYAKDGNTVGNISVTVTGNVHGYAGYGVDANRFSAGAGDISVTVGGAVTSSTVGVHTWNFGGSGPSGNEAIGVGGQITSGGVGVSAVTIGTGSVGISTAGVTAGGAQAIYASTHGSTLTIHAGGDISAATGAGVVGQTTGAGSGAVNVTLDGAVTAQGYGVKISAFSGAGTGPMRVPTARAARWTSDTTRWMRSVTASAWSR